MSYRSLVASRKRSRRQIARVREFGRPVSLSPYDVSARAVSLYKVSAREIAQPALFGGRRHREMKSAVVDRADTRG